MSVPFRPLFSSAFSRTPQHWGKATWDAIFLLASDFPHFEKTCEVHEDQLSREECRRKQRAFKKMLEGLMESLPCSICSEHFRKAMQKNKGKDFQRALQDRELLFRWLYLVKNDVNKRNRKKSISFEAVKRKYIAKCSICGDRH